MFIGQVVTKSKTLPIVDYVKTIADYEDNGMPTLIIGKNKAESIFGKDQVKVLDKKIKDNVYWTFAKNERRVDFEADIEAFNNIIVNKLKKSVKYVYYSIFTENTERTKKFIDWLYNGKKKIIYIYEKHLYMYAPKTDTVFGISLNDIEYTGKDPEMVLEKIKANKNNIIIYDNTFLGQRLRLEMANSQFIVPYLYFLRGE